MEYSKSYNRDSKQDDNEIQSVVVLAPFRHDHKTPELSSSSSPLPHRPRLRTSCPSYIRSQS